MMSEQEKKDGTVVGDVQQSSESGPDVCGKSQIRDKNFL